MLHGFVIDEDTEVALAGGLNLCFNTFAKARQKPFNQKKVANENY